MAHTKLCRRDFASRADYNKARLAEINVRYWGGSENWTEEELNLAIAMELQERRDLIAKGSHPYPPNVCPWCSAPLEKRETECRPSRSGLSKCGL